MNIVAKWLASGTGMADRHTVDVPVVAAFLHNASSVTVVPNSSRLIHHQLPARSNPPPNTADQGVVNSSPRHARIAASHG
ncbi:MAG: hypothetical protein LC721_08680 [Actinobacteria bacterium]|nr:hypothetical protein [Actinomycetota bacterium]